ncbi:hypothetical protein San01_39380 [Streptomyces angustmyceticus]|uniref:DUF5753 domain-containing protein n=1 Tax=Streptomyces angustmyceticus TaxID=285578 RepID=A0A5J4LHR4_9ACTN|nr:hypothetical protein San01_39380 [Streptomyces angustmyceticus]
MIEETVTARLERAHLLDHPTTPLLWVVLDEAVLRRKTGGPVVMAEALWHMAELIRKHRVIVQVLPFSAGGHAAMISALKLMAFTDAPSLAYIEGPEMGLLEDGPAIVARHALAYDLVGASALSPQDSLALIESVAEDYAHEDQP